MDDDFKGIKRGRIEEGKRDKGDGNVVCEKDETKREREVEVKFGGGRKRGEETEKEEKEERTRIERMDGKQ